MQVPMKTSAKVGIFSLLVASGASSLFGCTYEAPRASTEVGSGGNEASSSSGAGGSAGQSTGGSGGLGGAGGGSCDPGTVKFCSIYSGPPETENKGVCKASQSSCSQSGSWLGCEQEVLPNIETCNSAMDVNCDDLVPCIGAPLAIVPPSGSATVDGDFILAMTSAGGGVGKDGNVYAVGGRGGSTAEPPNNLRVLAWQRDANGTIHDWSNYFDFTPNGNNNGAIATGVVVVPNSNDVLISGVFVGGGLKIGSSAPVNTTLPVSFLARFSADGAFLNSRMINVSGSLNTRTMAIDPAGNIYIGGSQSNAPTIDGVTFTFASEPKGFVIQLSPAGKYNWHHVFKNSGTHEVAKIALFDNNNIVTATEFVGPLTYTQVGNTEDTVFGGPDTDILVNRLRSADGLSQWRTQIISTGVNSPRIRVGGVAVREGAVTIGGTFRGTINIGGKAFNVSDPMDTADAFVTTLDGASGGVGAKMAMQAVGVQDIQAVAYDSIGDLVIGGSFSGSMPFPGQTLMTALGLDAFVVKTDTTITPKWAHQFGDASDQVVQALSIGKNAGHIYAGGAFQGKLEGVTPLLTSAGYYDAFLLQLSN